MHLTFMPFRLTAAKELGALLATLAHPHRLLIVKELQTADRDVKSLVAALGLPQPVISQHLNRLRLVHLVKERRENRHAYYRLSDPLVATWLDQGFELIMNEAARSQAVAEASSKARLVWSNPAQAAPCYKSNKDEGSIR